MRSAFQLSARPRRWALRVLAGVSMIWALIAVIERRVDVSKPILKPTAPGTGSSASTVGHAISRTVAHHATPLLTGVVTDSAGAPLAGVRACRSGAAEGERVGSMECTLTDAAGGFGFELTRGAQDVFASAPGFAADARRVMIEHERSDVRVSLQLAPAKFAVSGTLIDLTGGVVAGARVTSHGTARGLAGIDVSDSLGHFTVSATSEVVELRAHASGYSLGQIEVRAPARDVLLPLVPESKISGRVISPHGDPVAGVSVVATNVDGLRAQPRTAVSDAEGTFLLHGLPAGRYDIDARSASWRGRHPSVTALIAEERELVISVVAAVSLTATVKMDGEARGVGYVSLRGPSDEEVEVDADGSVVIEGLVPGDYHVSVGCFGQPHEPIRENLLVGNEPIARNWIVKTGREQATDEPQIIDVPGSMEISGRVVDAQGAPVPDAWVRATRHGSLDHRTIPRLTDIDGSFTLVGLHPGAHSVSADVGLASARVNGVDAGSRDVSLQVTPHGGLFGQVISVSGHAEQFSLAYRRQGEPEGGITYGWRQWTLPWLPEGTYELVALSASGMAIGRAEVQAGTANEVWMAMEPPTRGVPQWAEASGIGL